ncbi:Inositol phosphatase SIW14 [Batrachochytrium dendrobatidis]
MFGDAVMQADRLPISQSQFKQVMATRMSKIDPDETIRQIFLLLDTESKGYINQEDLGNGLKKCIPHHSQSLEVGSILSKHITSNQSGFNVKITYRQFRQIIATFTQSKYSDIKV